MQTTPPLRIEVAARTDRGRERADNQDNYLVIAPPGWAALAVCDGMGGAAGGEVASSTAVAAIHDEMMKGGLPATHDALGRRLLHSVEEASRRVYAKACARAGLSGMGTTATACAIREDVLFIAQVGDSRAYLFREGSLTQLTRDQTLAMLLVENGQLAPEDVEDFPHGHVILQAVGTKDRVEVDLRRVRVSEGDVLLLCSDGLHGSVRAEAIREVLARATSPDAACEALVALANEAGGPDNITVIVARAHGAALAAPAGPPAPEKAVLEDEEPPRVSAISAVNIANEDTQPEQDLLSGVLARLSAIFQRRRVRTTG
jgi:protein phosphatase